MKEKVLAIVFILVGAAIGWIALEPEAPPPPPPQKTLQSLLTESIRGLQTEKLIPKEWGQIQYVVYNFHSSLAKELMGAQKLKIPETPQGQFRLEIDFIDVTDEKNPALLMQLSLFELQRNNKFWEHSQNIPISELISKSESSRPTSVDAADAATGAQNKKPDEVSPIGSK